MSILFPAQLNLLLEVETSAPPPGPTPLRLVITHAWNERFRAAFGVELATVWGMTETGALCVGSDPGEDGGEGFIGVPMEGVEVKVADDSLSPVPLGSTGEICLRHRHVMLGYLADEEATAATLADGWVRSGDIGLEREGGRFFFAGRLKNLIKRSGENVSGEEVEAALDEHPLVAESLVFGVPDRLRTEEVAALVAVAPGAAAGPGRDRRVRWPDRLARWKLPRYRDPLRGAAAAPRQRQDRPRARQGHVRSGGRVGRQQRPVRDLAWRRRPDSGVAHAAAARAPLAGAVCLGAERGAARQRSGDLVP